MTEFHPEIERAYGLFGAGKTTEGLAAIEALAAAGHPDGLFALADVHWRGIGVPQSCAAGRAAFERASEAGHPLARITVTNLLANGIAGPRDWPAAIERLREEARGDRSRAQALQLVEAMALTADGEPAEAPQGERLSDAPEVELFRGLLSPAECYHLIALANPRFAPSIVLDGKGGTHRDPIRTSDGAGIHWLVEDPAIHAINRRVAAASRTQVDWGETLHILRYRPGQEYKRHCDWLGDDQPRLKTALLYLNEGYEGGETEFPKIGLRVRGNRGDMLLFRNATPGLKLDPATEHAGLPVTDGVKYLATRWIRSRPYLV